MGSKAPTAGLVGRNGHSVSWDSWPCSVLSLASLWHFFLFDLPSCQWHLSSLLLLYSLLFLFSHLPKRKWHFFPPYSLEDFILQDVVTAFPLLWIEPFWSRQNYHRSPEKVTWICLVYNKPHKETAHHEELLNWKECLYSPGHLSILTRGKLKDSHLNLRSITLYISCFIVTLEQ